MEAPKRGDKLDHTTRSNLNIMTMDFIDTLTSMDIVIDSDVDNAIAECEAAIEELEGEELGEAKTAMVALREFQSALSDTAISEDHFAEHARELASDSLGVDLGQWPATHIDWETAATELQMDYTVVELDGTTFYMR